MTAGAFLKKMRKQHGYSIMAVVQKSNGMLDKTSLSRIERDERGVNLKVAYALSRIYNIPMENLSERIIHGKIEVDKMPFETSDDERTLLEAFRFLEKDRKKIVFDIVWGLAEFGRYDSNDSEQRLRESLAN